MKRYQSRSCHQACDDVLDCQGSVPFLSRLRGRFRRLLNPMRLDGDHRYHRCTLLCSLSMPWRQDSGDYNPRRYRW